jgi:hypothetical protein
MGTMPQIIITDKILAYIAEKVIDDLRNKGKFEDDSLAMDLTAFPFCDPIRSRVTNKDIHILFKLFLSGQKGNQTMALSLLRSQEHQGVIKRFIVEQWEKSREDFEIRYHLMWRLLDFEDLDIDMHNNIYNFVIDNWERWQKRDVIWFKGEECVLDVCLKRLSDDKFPPTKAWAYLCASMAAPEKDQVRELMESYKDSNVSIVGSVARDMLARLG